MFKRTLITVLIIIVIVGCQKSERNNITTHTKNNILNSNAHLIDTLAIAELAPSSVRLHKDKLSFVPVVGDILLASAGGNATYGMLVKVVSIVDNGNDIVCNVQPSNLNEAFAQLYIDYSQAVNYSNTALLRRTDPELSLTNTFDHSHLFSSALTFSGNLQLVFPKVIIKYVKDSGSLLPDTVIVSASMNSGASRISMQSTPVSIGGTLIEWGDDKHPLPDIFIPVPIGEIIVWIPFQQKVKLEASASISSKMTVTVIPAISATLGVSYINGVVTNLSDCKIGASADPLHQDDFDAELSANIEIKPVYELYPLHNPYFNLFFELPNDIEASIRTSRPNYQVKYKVAISAGGTINFFGIDKTLAVTIPIWEPTLLEGNWGYSIGDTTFGGIIYYLDSTRRHGRVYSLADLSNATFFDGGFYNTYWGYFTPNLDSSLGSGITNTDMIISSFAGRGNIASVCKSYNGGGYSDWYLPSLNELKPFYSNKDSLHGLSGTYWSSSCYTENKIDSTYTFHPYYLNLSTGFSDVDALNGYGDGYSSPAGVPGVAPGTIVRKVRAIRNF